MSNQTLSYTFRGNDDTVTTALPVTTKSANYTVSASDDVGREFTFNTSTSDLTASLPTASTAGNGFNVILRNIGIGVLTIDPSGTETIDGELTEDVPADQVRWIRSDGLSWRSVVGIDAISPTSGASAENILINGGFDIWQRGTSFTTTGYTADRWHADEATGAFTVSQQSFVLGQMDVPGQPEFFIEYDMTSGSASAPTLAQRVEDVRTLAGVTATLSFYAKVASGTLLVTPRLRQNFGTGGSPSTDVDTDASNITITSSWQLFEVTFTVPSISGKTLGTDDNDYLSAMLVLPTSSTFTLSVSQIKMEAGEVATAFVPKSIGDVTALCQRYYQEIDKRALIWSGSVPVTGLYYYVGTVYPTEMRTTPSTNIVNYSNSGHFTNTCGIAGVNSKAIRFNNIPTSTANDAEYNAGVELDAEL